MRKLLVAIGLVLLAACGATPAHSGPRNPQSAPSRDPDELVTTSPRTLAAVIDVHLADHHLGDHSGEVTPGTHGLGPSVSAFVDFADSQGRTATVFASVSSNEPGSADCGQDSRYRTIVCERSGRRVLEVAEAIGEAGDKMPRLIGRVSDTGDRPRVALVLTYGDGPSPRSAALVRELLEDVDLGPRSARRFELAGARISPFEASRLTSRARRG